MKYYSTRDALHFMKIKYKVVVKTLPQDSPRNHEMSAAILVANYFKTDVIFLRPSSLKSPDLKIKNAIWELKSPIGNSKNTIHNNIKGARKQYVKMKRFLT